MLLVPDGDSSRRRHAHSSCVMAARRAGRLPTRDEWLRERGEPTGGVGAWLGRFFKRGRKEQ